jgi:hypothetical protein
MLALVRTAEISGRMRARLHQLPECVVRRADSGSSDSGASLAAAAAALERQLDLRMPPVARAEQIDVALLKALVTKVGVLLDCEPAQEQRLTFVACGGDILRGGIDLHALSTASRRIARFAGDHHGNAQRLRRGRHVLCGGGWQKQACHVASLACRLQAGEDVWCSGILRGDKEETGCQATFSCSAVQRPEAASAFIFARWARARWPAATFSGLPAQAFSASA